MINETDNFNKGQVFPDWLQVGSEKYVVQLKFHDNGGAFKLLDAIQGCKRVCRYFKLRGPGGLSISPSGANFQELRGIIASQQLCVPDANQLFCSALSFPIFCFGI